MCEECRKVPRHYAVTCVGICARPPKFPARERVGNLPLHYVEGFHNRFNGPFFP